MTMLNNKILEGCNEEQTQLMHQACFEDDQNHTEETVLLLKQIIEHKPNRSVCICITWINIF